MTAPAGDAEPEDFAPRLPPRPTVASLAAPSPFGPPSMQRVGLPPPASTVTQLAYALRPLAAPVVHAPVQRRRVRYRRPSFLARLGIRLVLSAVITLGWWAARSFEHRSSSTPPISFPKQWDARVLPIVTFVERERGLVFKHPVQVDFLSEADYVAQFTRPTAAPSDAAKKSAADYSALLDAEGLAMHYNALAGSATVQSVSTLGFYSFSQRRIIVRGSALSAPVRVVLAHELTHVLQDQNFTITTGGPDDLRLRSVGEADAMRVDQAYEKTLPKADQGVVDRTNSITPGAQKSLDSVPAAVVQQQEAPYVLGPLLVSSVYAAHGTAGIDELLRAPPTEWELINPWSAARPLAERTMPVAAPSGAVVFDKPQSLSMLTMLLMLDSWLPWTQARGALDDWAGGGFVSYHKGGASGPMCFTATATFDGSPQPFAAAVARWATAAKSDARPAVHGGDVTFEACARASSAKAPPKQVVDTLNAIRIESSTISGSKMTFTTNGVRSLRCIARFLIDDRTVAPLLVKHSWSASEKATYLFVRNAHLQRCGLQVGG
ncbi:MAG: hypothetical protein WCI22_03740 [Actinomycetota bacterium]